MSKSKALTAEDIEAAFAAVAPKSRLCRVGQIIADNPALGARIMDVEHYSSKTISKVLKHLGFGSVADSTVTNHRRDTCMCPKEG